MLDRYLSPWVESALTPMTHYLDDRNVKANHVTLAAFGVGMLALPALAMEWYVLALILMVINRLGDGIDGALARRNQSTEQGSFLDTTLDFIFYLAMVAGFVLASELNVFWGALLMLGFASNGISFLAFSFIAERNALNPDTYPQKGIYYLANLVGGTETMIFFVLCCLFPHQFPFFASIFFFICGITTLIRIYKGAQMLNRY